MVDLWIDWWIDAIGPNQKVLDTPRDISYHRHQDNIPI